MTPLVFAMPGNEGLADGLGRLLALQSGVIDMRHFPDGESYIRFLTAVQGRDIVLVCTLNRPDRQVLPLYLAARIARELGANSVGLIAPYLPYRRQEAWFQTTEGQTPTHFAHLLDMVADWLVTIAPQPHRHHSLNDIYNMPTRVVQATPEISQWISHHVQRPLVIGLDAENAQWAAEIAAGARCPVAVLQTRSHGDGEVQVSMPDCTQWKGHTPVLVDDIASTAHTMVVAARQLQTGGLASPVCVVVHPIFTGKAYAALQNAGVATVVSCNSISHESNRIDLCRPIAAAVHHLITHHARHGCAAR